MEAILNANFHFNRGVEFGVSAQRVDHDVQLLGDVIESSDHRGTEEISVSAQEGNRKHKFYSSSSNQRKKLGDVPLKCEHVAGGFKK